MLSASGDYLEWLTSVRFKSEGSADLHFKPPDISCASRARIGRERHGKTTLCSDFTLSTTPPCHDLQLQISSIEKQEHSIYESKIRKICSLLHPQCFNYPVRLNSTDPLGIILCSPNVFEKHNRLLLLSMEHTRRMYRNDISSLGR